MSSTSTMTFLFSDIVGSTDLLNRLGARDWDDVRRSHFSMLRAALAEHDGTEVKNTGDGLMAAFSSVLDAVHCSITMQQQAAGITVSGRPLSIRIGIASGEAAHDDGDWFGTPVVEAARLCALAGTNESWTTELVRLLAGTQANATFVGVGEQSLKGFDKPIEVFRIEPDEPRVYGMTTRSMYAAVEEHERVGDRLVAQLDYWEQLPSLQKMRAAVFTELAPLPGDVICDIGCGTGSELIQIARIIGPEGTAIAVDPSATMLEEARTRAKLENVELELVVRDGRDTGLPDNHCDAVRIERVIQHVGDLMGFLAEARRITRPGGRVVVADTDWGSMMMHPGDPDLVRRVKNAFETGPMPEPWAGRILHHAMVEAGLTDVTSEMFPISTGPGVTDVLRTSMFDRFVAARVATQAEMDVLVAELDAALDHGGMVVAFTMFVVSGRVPE